MTAAMPQSPEQRDNTFAVIPNSKEYFLQILFGIRRDWPQGWFIRSTCVFVNEHPIAAVKLSLRLSASKFDFLSI